MTTTKRQRKPEHTERSNATPIDVRQRAIDNVIDVTNDALYFMEPRQLTSAQRKCAAKLIVAYREEARALRTRARTLPAELLKEHKVRRHYLGPVLSALTEIGAKKAAWDLRFAPIVPMPHSLVSGFSHKQIELSASTVRRALACLGEAGIVLYAHGRSRHPSLVGFPGLVDRHASDCGRVLIDLALKPAPGWWQPMVHTLLRQHDEHEADDRRDLARALRARVEALELELKHQRDAKAGIIRPRIEARGEDPNMLRPIDEARAKAQRTTLEARAALFAEAAIAEGTAPISRSSPAQGAAITEVAPAQIERRDSDRSVVQIDPLRSGSAGVRARAKGEGEKEGLRPATVRTGAAAPRSDAPAAPVALGDPELLDDLRRLERAGALTPLQRAIVEGRAARRAELAQDLAAAAEAESALAPTAHAPSSRPAHGRWLDREGTIAVVTIDGRDYPVDANTGEIIGFDQRRKNVPFGHGQPKQAGATARSAIRALTKPDGSG